MIDKIKLFMPKTASSPDLSPILENAKMQTDIHTGETFTFGYIGGMRVNCYVGGYSIYGSLVKYYYGDNISSLDRRNTARAIEKLSDMLHIDFRQAKITEIEFGTNFIMSKPIEVYLKKLGTMPRLMRNQIEAKTLYYMSKGKAQSKTFCFYDKISDAEKKGMYIPIGFENSYLLRYEMRFKGRLPQQIGVPEVTASLLSEREFYTTLAKKWETYYFMISKQSLSYNIINEIKTVSDAFGIFIARLISQSDQSEINAFLDEIKDAKVFSDRKNYTRLKKKLTDVSGRGNKILVDEDIKELDDAVKNAVAYI